jgi:hypothetical protein
MPLAREESSKGSLRGQSPGRAMGSERGNEGRSAEPVEREMRIFELIMTAKEQSSKRSPRELSIRTAGTETTMPRMEKNPK